MDRTMLQTHWRSPSGMSGRVNSASSNRQTSSSGGHPTADAENLLRLFRKTQGLYVADLDTIRDELRRLG